MGYKVNKRYVGTQQVRPGELVLKQIFDFSTNDWKGFTMTSTNGAGIAIDTSGGYCYGASGSPFGNGVVWKQINAKKFWGRIKFMNVNYKSGGPGIGTFQNYTPTPTGAQDLSLYVNNDIIQVSINGSTKTTGNISTSLNTYYYLDGKFDNGLYTCTLYDENMTKLKEITYQSGDTTWNYSGFFFRGGNGNNSNWRVYEYREAYDNN